MKIKPNKLYTASFNYIGEITLKGEVVNACSHQGQCDADVKACLQREDVIKELSSIPPEKLIQELREYGAWDEQELSNHNDNLERILWIAAGDIQDDKNVTYHK